MTLSLALALTQPGFGGSGSPPPASLNGQPMGLLLLLTHTDPAPPRPSAGQPTGLLLLLTKAS